MWVFYQAALSLYVDGDWIEQPIQVMPYPLDDDLALAPSGILWSPWEGLMLDDWVHIPDMGAIRFFGQKIQYGRRVWDIDFADLHRWGFDADPHYLPVAASAEGARCHAECCVEINRE